MQAGAEIIFLPHPRRFGKTLNLSMLRAFFERCPAETEHATRETLFHGLAIHDTPCLRDHFARYPVISLTFKDVKEQDHATALFKLELLLRTEAPKTSIPYKVRGAIFATGSTLIRTMFSSPMARA